MHRTLLSCSLIMGTPVLLSHLLLVCGVSVFLYRGVASHGRLIEPPGRSTMWRYGFNTPVNYNDNQLFCGGSSHQWGSNGGKCGVCGDPYDGPRENEAGGKYATGTISRCYNDTPSPLVVKVQITANHLGYFEFRLCPHDNISTPVKQECLDNHLLKLYGTEDTRFYISAEIKVYEVQLEVPSSITCSQCVLQWKYNTGNSWGCDNKGKCGIGYGSQEQFYGCADISIGEDCNAHTTTSTFTPSADDHQSSTQSITFSTGQPDYTNSTYTSKSLPSHSTVSTTTMNQEETQSATNSTTTSKSSSAGNIDCRAAEAYTGQAMNKWCKANCAIGYCPASHCICTTLASKSPSSIPTTTISSPMSSSSLLITTEQISATDISTKSTTDASTDRKIELSTTMHLGKSSTTTRSMHPSNIFRNILTTSENIAYTIDESTADEIGSTQSTVGDQTIERLTTDENLSGNEKSTTLPSDTDSSTEFDELTSVNIRSTYTDLNTESMTESEEPTTQIEHSTGTTTQSTTRNEQTTSEEGQSQSMSCVPTSAFSSVAGMDAWCETNCKQGYCPSTHCICT